MNMLRQSTKKYSVAAVLCWIALFVAPIAAASSDDKGAREGNPESKPATTIEEQLQKQTVMLQQMQEILVKQQGEIERLRGEMDAMRAPATTAVAATSEAAISPGTAAAVAQPAESAEAGEATDDDGMSKRVDTLEQRWGKLKLTGDFRLRYEGFFNQGFDAANDVDPRHRVRLRARAQLTGELDKHFDWGIRLATGNFNDPISTNQTLSDFYNRKPFALDRAYMRFNSRTDPVELELTAGKFDYTWRRTPLTFDADLQPEGLSQSVKFKLGDDTPLRSVKLVAWQLPFLERTIGTDAWVFGGQIQTDWKWSDNWSSTLNGTFHDFEQVDTLAPATNALGTLVNAGFNYATTNATFTNSLGRAEFFSEFRVIDVLGELRYTGFGDKDAKGETKWPLTIRMDWVHNTSAFDNNRDGGHATIELGRNTQADDWQLEYAFYKSERDAFPSVFGESDLLNTNGVTHWIRGAYTINRQVWIDVRHMFQRRILTTGPEDRWLNRLQFDVHYRF